MKYTLIKDNKRRQEVLRFEKKRKILKTLKVNEFLPLTVRAEAALSLHNTKGSKSYLKNHCTKSARARGMVSKFRLSRLEFKKRADFGFLPGVFKASW